MKSGHIGKIEAEEESTGVLAFPASPPRPVTQGPAQNQNLPHFAGRIAQSKFTLPGSQPALPTRLSLSRFAPSLYEKMLMQLGITLGPAREPAPFGPFLAVDAEAARRKPANDSGLSRFLPSQKTEGEKGKSRFLRLTIETLLQLGAMPGQLLAEVGRLKQRRAKNKNQAPPKA